MAWIKSFQELGDHPKTKRAARILGISCPTIIGHLQYLWLWAQSYAEDGCLGGYSVEDVADAARWEGDAQQFIDALLNCGVKGAGFLERDDLGELHIHDWDEYAGKLVERRATERERQRNKRASGGGVGATLAQHTQDVGATYAPRVEEEKSRVESEDTAGAAAPPSPPVPIKSKGRTPKQDRLATLTDAFRAAGLKSPVYTPTEAKAAGILLDYYSPDTLAECWRDVQQGSYRARDGWMKGQLSFQALSLYNRVQNWLDWCEAGRPQEASPPPNGRPEPAPRIVRTL